MKLIACQECKRQWDVSRYRVGQKLRCVCNFVMQVPRQKSYTPEVHHCEACGAARPAASMTPCQYCGAVPTRDSAALSLVCPLCMHRTAQNSRFCSSCGKAIEATKIDVKTGKLKCPRCQKTRLINRTVGAFMVDECPTCSGMWVEPGAFDRIVGQQANRQLTQFSHQSAKGRPIRSKLDTREVVYLKCPVCQRHMHRRNFGRASGVIIDECKDDGVWLDCDELGKIAAYVASGGLQYTKRVLTEEKAQAHKPGPVSVPTMSSFPVERSPLRGAGTPLGTVLDVVRALFG